MKKALVVATLLIYFTIGSLNAQVYQGFPNVDGYWKAQYGFIDCLDIHFLNDICSEYQYILEGDTVIDAEIYHKINYSGRDRNSLDETWIYWDLGYFGCYRNDIANKRVYYIAKDSTNEVLLYDFNINLYDTLPETFVYNSAGNIITVDQIDSILVNNIYLKRYHLDNAGFGGAYLIEGIGTTLGLFSPITPFFEQHYDLLCFKNEEKELYYFINDSSDCNLITDIRETSTLSYYITLFPNPASTAITISLPTITPIDNTTLSIYNVNARQVISCYISEPTTIIDISTLPGGVYFVRITTDATVLVNKFIKQ